MTNASVSLNASITNSFILGSEPWQNQAMLAPVSAADAADTLAGQPLTCTIEGLNPSRTKAYLPSIRRLPFEQGPFVASGSVRSSTSEHKP